MDFPRSFYPDILAADEWSNKRPSLFFYTCETGSPVQNVYCSVKRANNNAREYILFHVKKWFTVAKEREASKISSLPTSSSGFVWKEPDFKSESNNTSFFQISTAHLDIIKVLFIRQLMHK